MEQLKQYGVSVITLSNLVLDYCLKMGNTKATAIARSLVFAREAWKDLFRTTIWDIRQAVLPVECGPEGETVRLPADCERVIGISVVDIYGKTQALTLNPYYNTVSVKCQESKCSCTKCNGQDSLCSAIDGITMTTATISIGGEDYTQTTWVKMGENGNIQKAIKTPYWDTLSEQVVYRTDYETVCQVTLNENGCIEPTLPNIQMLGAYLGWGYNSFYTGYSNGGYNSAAFRQTIQTSYNYYGEWNYNATANDIIHIFRRDQQRKAQTLSVRNDFTGNQQTASTQIDKVIVSYQTNGESPGTEILVPEFATMAIHMHMILQTELYNPKRVPAQVDDRRRSYNIEKMKVIKWLNPIKMGEIAKMQANQRLW